MENLEYDHNFERLLKAEAEKCECLGILHNLSHLKYNKLSISVNIPVIVLSAIIGFLGPLTLFHGQEIFLGIMSIGIGVLKSVESYLDFTKKSEGHRIISLSYFKISKFIQIQLTLKNEVRVNAKDLYTIITADIQNLKDKEPPIDTDIIDKFKKRYKDEFENPKTSKPAILNGLTEVKIYTELPKPPETLEV